MTLFWIGLGIVAVLSVITVYSCCCAAADWDQWLEDHYGIRRS